MDPASNTTPAPAVEQAPAPSPPQQSAGFSAPEGFELVPKEYRTQAERWREQIAPGQKWAETAKKAGFSKPEEFDDWAGFLTEARKRGVSPKALAAVYADNHEPVQRDEPPKTLTHEDVQRMIADSNSTIMAEQEYASMSAREKALLEANVDEIAGPNADAWTKSLVKRTLAYEAAMARSEYDEGSPLRKKGYFKPLDEQGFGSLKSRLTAERDAAKAAALEAKGNAAQRAQTVSTPAGSTGGHGKSDTNGQQKVPFHKLPRAERLALAEKMRGQGSPTLA